MLAKFFILFLPADSAPSRQCLSCSVIAPCGKAITFGTRCKVHAPFPMWFAVCDWLRFSAMFRESGLFFFSPGSPILSHSHPSGPYPNPRVFQVGDFSPPLTSKNPHVIEMRLTRPFSPFASPRAVSAFLPCAKNIRNHPPVA